MINSFISFKCKSYQKHLNKENIKIKKVLTLMFSVVIFISTSPTLLTFALLSSSLNSKTNSSLFLQRTQLKNLKFDDKILLAKQNGTMPNFLMPNISLIASLTNNNLVASTDELKNEGNDEYLIILPFIVLFGLCGNTISLIAIFHSRLRKMAANQYLIVLTLADSVFLLGVIMVLFKVDFTGYLFCVSIEYVLMCASYISSWSITALTIERYLAIVHPLKHVQYGYVSRWRIMCFWIPIPFILNLIQFITLTPNFDSNDPNWPNVRKCTINDGQLQMIVEIIDVVLCYMLPCIIVVVLNLLIASKVESSEKTFNKRQKAAASATNLPIIIMGNRSNSSSKNSIITNGETVPQICNLSKRVYNNRSKRYISKIIKKENNNGIGSLTYNSITPGSSTSSSGSTKILVVVPIVYILLNTPFYMIRMIDTIALNIFHYKAFSIQGGLNDQLIVFLYNAAHYLYYVNFACDVVVYAFSSANFRRTVILSWRRLLCSKWAKENEYLDSMVRSNYNRSNTTQDHAIQKTRLINSTTTNTVTQLNNNINEIKIISNIKNSSLSKNFSIL